MPTAQKFQKTGKDAVDVVGQVEIRVVMRKADKELPKGQKNMSRAIGVKGAKVSDVARAIEEALF